MTIETVKDPRWSKGCSGDRALSSPPSHSIGDIHEGKVLVRCYPGCGA
jgi:hypothetical protein